jgi:isoamylase
MRYTHPDLQFTHILPYGAVVHDHGVQFVVFSRNATEMRLLFYDHVDDPEPTEVLHFNRDKDRWGDIWSVFVPEIEPGQLYHFQAVGPNDPSKGMRFDSRARLIDPYAKALAGKFLKSNDGIIRPPKCVVVDDYFDWAGDRHLRRELSETVIYEMHVKGFTRHESANTKKPGTYLGIIEKIPYLKSLGVTAVELMPVHEFPINNFDGSDNTRPNFWGYDPLSFFAPHRGYASGSEPGCQVNEFKTMVKALHEAGIEVILDVVFNHTCEGNEKGPTLSFKGLENSVYYMLENDLRYYKNFTGCGNTVNGNHPIVREMIFHCLRHWVHNYHIDGFRFDLASILSRDRQGHLVANPPLVESIGEDPLLADTKIIAEAWDAAGAYQVGTFGSDRWAEWNGRYRDDIRQYWRGSSGMRGALATRLAGSSDLYQPGGRTPYNSINFVTSHDGFTLNDLVTYNEKHNTANGENNRDGENNNLSDNHGIEGPTDRKQIDDIRLRQIKNFWTTLLLSQGVPMIVAGDECRRTQQGNNNAYCQDNEISWFDWDLVKQNHELLRFCQALIEFRKTQPAVRREQFLTGTKMPDERFPDVSWFSPLGTAIDWHDEMLPLLCLLTAPEHPVNSKTSGNAKHRPRNGVTRKDVMLMFNPTNAGCDFILPSVCKAGRWKLFIDTSEPSPMDIYPDLDGPDMPTSGRIDLPPKCASVFVADPIK